LLFNKSTEAAISAASLLAEVWCDGGGRLTASQIAEGRHLPRPFVAKLLTALARADLVAGSPGPNGGYSLRRPPEEISLLEIVRCFERERMVLSCPFGPDYCGSTEEKCPLHEQVVELQGHVEAFLANNNIGAFCKPSE
jgi:Rrf2 family transcriptional regulator, iron-sulfur cluster assembly transcription factor